MDLYKLLSQIMMELGRDNRRSEVNYSNLLVPLMVSPLFPLVHAERYFGVYRKTSVIRVSDSIKWKQFTNVFSAFPRKAVLYT